MLASLSETVGYRLQADTVAVNCHELEDRLRHHSYLMPGYGRARQGEADAGPTWRAAPEMSESCSGDGFPAAWRDRRRPTVF